MVSMGTRVASNPFHTFANSLSLPGLQLIIEKLQLPLVIVFPHNFLFGPLSVGNEGNFMMLGLANMVREPFLLCITKVSLPTSKIALMFCPWFSMNGLLILFEHNYFQLIFSPKN